MKSKLIVVDFDKTLIPFDSFRQYVLIWLRKYPLQIMFLIFKRKIKILSSGEFKKRVVQLIYKHKLFEVTNHSFATVLCKKLDIQILEKIEFQKTPATKILILSASPDEYIGIIGDNLGFAAKGSHFISDNEYFHLHSDAKIKYINTNYPIDMYEYQFAISDSISDLKLLKLFSNYELLVPHKSNQDN